MVGRVNPKKRFLLFLKLWSYEVIICITKNRNVIAISVDKPPFALKFATIGLLLMVSYKCTYDFDIKKTFDFAITRHTISSCKISLLSRFWS